MNDDQELLRAFAEDKSQAAFAALVQRHLPMIYAAARRQTGDAHQAEEVALTAFTLLARRARSLRDHPTLGGWLYTTTGHLAARLRRSEARRTRREQAAHAMNEANTPAPDLTGENLRPIIDELLLALPEHDRTAVLLRYFENRTHDQIGERLGLSGNAARMRIDRALERLRTTLGQRGLTSTTAALGVALSAHATLAPPAGLAAGITTGATAAAAGGGLLLLMNTPLLKTGLVTAAVAIGAGGLFWQFRENARLRQEVASLQAPGQPAQASAGQPPSPTPDAGEPLADFARLGARVAGLPADAATSWQERADVLQELMTQFPEMQIPELALATPEDWLDATKAPLTTDHDYRRALAQVRTAVVMRFCSALNQGLQSYLKQHDGAFPSTPAELEPYFTNAIGPEIWNRYKIVPASRTSVLKLGGATVLVAKSVVDPNYDTHVVLGPQGIGSTPFRTFVLEPVFDAYRAAHPDRPPATAADLLPFTKTNAQRSALRAALGQK